MSKATIVLIDDQEEMRENIKEILELDGYTVFEAANGKDGVRLIRKTRPELIICDIMMPELDGYGVLKIISQDEELSGTPFIFLTAKNDLSDFRAGMNMGADDYLTKPFTDLELIEAIDTRLTRFNKMVSKNSESSKVQIEDAYQWKPIHFHKNEVIFRAGSYSERIYQIKKGQVKLTKQNIEGKTLITEIIQEGDYFGHINVIAEKPYSTTAIALTNIELSYLTKSEFQCYLVKDKLFCKRISKELANHVRTAENQLLSMAFSSVRKRVIESLLTLNKQFNPKQNSTYKISIQRNEIAAISGTVKETAIRCLKDLEQEGFITLHSRSIQINDIQSLSNLCKKKVT